MLGYNGIIVLNETEDKVLMCIRQKAPYKGLSNFVGGKINSGEDGLTAAYRELAEETSIRADQIELVHFMDLTYFAESFYIEVYVGKLRETVEIKGEENPLYWCSIEEDFFDSTRFAGEGNIGHIIRRLMLVKDQIF